MPDEMKNIPELAAGLVSPEYAAERPIPKLRPIADRAAREIGAALDRVIGADKPFPRRNPNEAACELIRDIGLCSAADPRVFATVKDVLVDWFGRWEKSGLSLCLALGLVDPGEIEDWAHDHGWRPPD